jgi:predicted dinucleotide-binding enzyme
VVLYTVRDVLPSALLQTPGVLAGKVVIDCTNNAILGLERPDPEGRPGIRFETADPPRTTRLATDAPQARIVKAFNSIPAAVFALHPETLRRSRASVMVCADDPEAKRMTEALAADLGFQMIDCGGLENDRMVEGAVDVLRYQVVATGWGAFVTLAINPVEQYERAVCSRRFRDAALQEGGSSGIGLAIGRADAAIGAKVIARPPRNT